MGHPNHSGRICTFSQNQVEVKKGCKLKISAVLSLLHRENYGPPSTCQILVNNSHVVEDSGVMEATVVYFVLQSPEIMS